MPPTLSLQVRGEISVKGKGIMLTYWVLGKGDCQLMSPSLMMPAGVPQSPSLQRQSSHHSSLAAVVLGMMQASKRNNIATTRKFGGIRGGRGGRFLAFCGVFIESLLLSLNLCEINCFTFSSNSFPCVQVQIGVGLKN